MSVTIKLRKGSSSDWASNSSIVLASGEPGFELDTGRLKIGNGTSTWANLDYASVVPTGFIAGSGIDIDLGANGSTATIAVSGSFVAESGTFNRIIFDTTLGDPDLEEGELAWNNSEGSLALGTSDTHAIFIGEEMLYRVRNNTGSVIRTGTPVYASGLTPGGNNRIEVAPYTADGNVREIRLMGLMMEDCNTGLNGYATHFGYIRGIDTRGDAASNGTTNKLWAAGEPSWSEGDILYIHPTVPGKLTKIEPKHSISVAIILNRHQQQGKLFVRPTSYGHLDDNHDVNVSGVTNGQYLQYNAATDYWVPTSSGNFTSLQVDKIKIDDNVITPIEENFANNHYLGISVDTLVIDTTQYSSVRGSGGVRIFGGDNPTLTITNEEDINYGPEIKFGSAGPNNSLVIGSYYRNNANAVENGLDVNVIDSTYRLDISSSGELRLNANPIRFGDGFQGYVYYSDGTLGWEMGLVDDMDNTIAIKNMGDSSYRYGGPNDSEFLVISSSGNVGIGNTNPSYKLDVNGSGNFAGGLFVDDISVSVSGHTHTSSDITDFDTAVSGAVMNILNQLNLISY